MRPAAPAGGQNAQVIDFWVAARPSLANPVFKMGGNLLMLDMHRAVSLPKTALILQRL
jgi:hypothetical protein